MKKKTALTAGVLTALAASAAVFTTEAYRFVFCRGGSRLLNPLLNSKGHEQDYYDHRDSTAEALRQNSHETFTLRSKRGELLKGYYFPCGGGKGKKIAFLVHGYHSEYAENAGMYLDYYASRGFDLFTCDNTAHGESEGRYIGFDAFESEDCLLWLDFLRSKFGDDMQIILHGFSLGAATVMAMSDRVGSSVKFIVEDSGFADGRAQLKGQLGPLYRPMAALHRGVAGCDLGDTDVRPHLKKATVPILFVHGQADGLVPFENGPALYELYQREKDCLFTPGVKHIETMHAAPEAYQAKLDAFMEKYIQ